MGLLLALAALPPVGGCFTAAGVWRRSIVDQALAAALLAADVVSARQLGKLLKRLTGYSADGVRLDRVGSNREGAVLRVWREQE
jgi:hypothetical protein